MRIYKFVLETYKGISIKKTEIEVEEKPKSYTILSKKTTFRTRILKSNIGKVENFCGLVVYLLEDDFSKAKELFISKMENDISTKKKKIDELNNSIITLNETIGKVKNMESEDE